MTTPMTTRKWARSWRDWSKESNEVGEEAFSPFLLCEGQCLSWDRSRLFYQISRWIIGQGPRSSLLLDPRNPTNLTRYEIRDAFWILSRLAVGHCFAKRSKRSKKLRYTLQKGGRSIKWSSPLAIVAEKNSEKEDLGDQSLGMSRHVGFKGTDIENLNMSNCRLVPLCPRQEQVE